MIRFKDLSFPLKTSVVISFVISGIWILFFFIGLIAGIIGGI